MSKGKVAKKVNEGGVKDLDGYLAETNGFYRELKERDRKREQVMMLSMKASWGITALVVIAIIMMLPLKQTVHDVLVLDKNAGTAEPLQTLAQVQLTLDETFHRNFLYTLVTAHERFVQSMAEDDYWTVAAFLSPQLQEEWGKLWDTNNSKSPLNLYRGKVVKPEILTYTLKPSESSGRLGVATVRYRKKVSVGGLVEDDGIWIATINYQLVDAATDPKVRAINYLGFQVTWYDFQREAGSRAQAR